MLLDRIDLPKNKEAILNHYPEEILSSDAFTQRSFKLFVNTIDHIDSISKMASDAYDSLKDSLSGAVFGEAVAIVKERDSADIQTKYAQSGARTVWSCALPLPNTLNDSQSHKWSSEEASVSKIVGGLASMVSLEGVNVTTIAREISNRVGARQPLINPGYYQDYTGSDMRSFTFDWDIIPRNAQESAQAKTIIKNLKRYSSPQVALGGVSLLSPYTFDILIGSETLNDMLKLRGVVIKNIDVDYSADGALQWLPDGTPKHMKLSITFEERSLTTADAYGAEAESEGGF